ncbi:MAG: L-rhamnose mutarotase [Limisphaerales bacterium]
MPRNAFKMKLKPGAAAEYKRRHDELWPELQRALREAGISDYTIFFDEETHTLFATQKLAESNAVDRLPQLPIMRQWWDYMAPLMEVHADHSPVVIPLTEVFHLD